MLGADDWCDARIALTENRHQMVGLYWRQREKSSLATKFCWLTLGEHGIGLKLFVGQAVLRPE